MQWTLPAAIFSVLLLGAMAGESSILALHGQDTHPSASYRRGTTDTQAQILLELYDATMGDHWADNRGWGGETRACAPSNGKCGGSSAWKGVTCNSDCQVSQMCVYCATMLCHTAVLSAHCCAHLLCLVLCKCCAHLLCKCVTLLCPSAVQCKCATLLCSPVVQMCDTAVPICCAQCCVNVPHCCACLLSCFRQWHIHLFGLQRVRVQLTARHYSGLPGKSLNADQVTASE